MTTIKANTKRAEQMLHRAENNEGYNLWDVYGTISQAKRNAWHYCHVLCKNENGYDFRIISHNNFNFSVAWEVVDPETGEIIGTRIETAQNSYFIEYNS